MATGKLRTIDTFSGTGGISLALRDFTTTSLYCEINPYCQAVLSERMKEGRLDRAPIHGDMRTLHLAPDAAPEMIMGGSPCTDVSCIGLKQGIADGPQSSLFYEIVRIVDETPSISVVFLENVANIVKCGLGDVVAELRKRDFNIYWTTKSAGSMGAPHMRNRWFCLATKVGYEVDLSRFQGASMARATATDHWRREPARRFTFRPTTKEDDTYDPNWALRCACMGNAVVPAVVRAAFVDLLKMHKNWQSLRETLLDYGGPVAELKYPFPESCVIIGDAYFAMPYRASGADPAALGPVEIKITPEREVTFNTLPTPRRGVVHACTPTERSVHDLPTLLVHSEINKPLIREALGVEELPEKLTSILYPNVQYVEWMMGYEPNWTRISTVMARQSGSSAPDRGAADDDGGSVPLPDGGTLSDLDDEGEPRPPPEPRPRQSAGASRRRSTVPDIPAEKRLNALNLFHREVFPHKTIKDICVSWRELPQAERKQYADRARVMRAAA